ncbi:LysE family translocator [Shewanella sp. 6_MG-2023]|uniref:LysE family translocator n=1 Tax=Shewanella sp. 6_MG-2023 TaxID=3062660 RepID=UPI0026E48B9C|nr:LysE family translocator [Shewanella sp. 6_MG-2023]MDO6618827.1 LysE family translocator [Shewanella sp. 6_MG-2023]
MDPSVVMLMLSAALFCATMTGTPGPNNVLLANSGANFGVKQTVPHMIGIRVGQTSLHVAMLLGLGSLFESWPLLHQMLKYASISYLIYLAVKIATQHGRNQASERAKPITLVEAAFFQWINPKTWMASISLLSAFTISGDLYWTTAIGGVLVFNIVGLLMSLLWVLIGSSISQKLNTPIRQRNFNWLMAAMLLSTLPMVLV